MKKLLSFILLSTVLNVGVAQSDVGHGTGFWIWDEVIVNCPVAGGSPFDSEYKGTLTRAYESDENVIVLKTDKEILLLPVNRCVVRKKK